MIPVRIRRYLEDNEVSYRTVEHPYVITAQEFAQAAHVSGYHTAKAVLLDDNGTPFIAVLPATEEVDPYRIGEVLRTARVRLCTEEELGRYFPDCERGAQPPFGGLYELPVLVDRSLTEADEILMRGGTHRDGIVMTFSEYARLEQPLIAAFGADPRFASPVFSVETQGWF